MNRTKIEWVKNPDGSPGYTGNPLSGCENHTPEGLCLGGLFPCYAFKLAHGRLKPLYLANDNIAEPDPKLDFPMGKDGMFTNPFYPRFWEDRLAEITKRNDRLYYDGAKTEYRVSPRGIFLCDMGDIFGIGVPEQWTEKVLDEIWGNKGYDRFYLLTKQPQELIKWSPFPDNAWVGVTATNTKAYIEANSHLAEVEAKVKYLSLEPLLEKIDCFRLPPLLHSKVSWLIIGACTGTFMGMVEICKRYPELTLMPCGKKWTLQPPIEWLREIVQAADKAGIRVFLKDNLKPLLRDYPEFWDDIPQGDHPNYESIAVLRQEMPG